MSVVFILIYISVFVNHIGFSIICLFDFFTEVDSDLDVSKKGYKHLEAGQKTASYYH